MSNAVLTRPDEIQWDQFFDHGFLIQRPNTNSIWGGYGQSDSSDLSFFHTKFFAKETAQFKPAVVFEIDKTLLIEEISKMSLKPPFLTLKSTTDQEFNRDLKTVIHKLKSSATLKKIVPVAMAEYECGGGHPLHCLKNMAEIQGCLYGFWNNGKGILGCSPEPLFWKDQEHVHFVALAGTAKNEGQSSKRRLLESKKDLIEHSMVVDDIRDKLKRIGIEDIEVKPIECIEYGELLHLQTKIVSKNSSISAGELVSALHPTAALCGYPHEESLAGLKSLSHYQFEKEKRSFGGVFGIESKQMSWGFVMIRNFQWDHKKIFIQSGCGVVAQSVVENEIKEIENKRESVLRFFNE